jgi:probable addiction module antidote protein
MTRKTRSYRDSLLKGLTDPVEAAHYLNAALDDSPEMFLKALRNVAQSRQMTRVAKDSGLTRESLYRSLSQDGNPTLETLHSVLGVLGLNIVVQPTRAIVVGTDMILTTAHAIRDPHPTIVVGLSDFEALNPIGNASSGLVFFNFNGAPPNTAGLTAMGNLSIAHSECVIDLLNPPEPRSALQFPIWAVPGSTAYCDSEKEL